MNRFRQKGTTTVEFAIVGTAMMLVLLLSIEMRRMIFVINTLGEATRRGGRMAAVCPINDPEISRVAVFNSSGAIPARSFMTWIPATSWCLISMKTAERWPEH